MSDYKTLRGIKADWKAEYPDKKLQYERVPPTGQPKLLIVKTPGGHDLERWQHVPSLAQHNDGRAWRRVEENKIKVTEQLKKAAREQIKQLIKERLDGIVDYGKNRVPIGHFNAFITMKDPSKAEQIAKWARGRMKMNKELGIEHQAMEVESVDSETGVVHLRGLAWTLSNFLESINTRDPMYDGTVSHDRPKPAAEDPAELSENATSPDDVDPISAKYAKQIEKLGQDIQDLRAKGAPEAQWRPLDIQQAKLENNKKVRDKEWANPAWHAQQEKTRAGAEKMKAKRAKKDARAEKWSAAKTRLASVFKEGAEENKMKVTREQVKKVVEAALMAKKLVAEIDYPIQYGRVSRTFKPGEDVEIPWTGNERIRGKVVDYNHRDGVYVVDIGRYQSETVMVDKVRSASRKVPFHDWQIEDRPSWAATAATKGNMEREEREAASAALVANLESELETGFYSPEDNTPEEVVRDLVDAGELLAKDAEEAYYKLLSMPGWEAAAERELEEAFDTFETEVSKGSSHMDPHLGLPLTQKGDEKCNKDPECRDRVKQANAGISRGQDFDSETGLPFSQKAMEKCKKDKGCAERAKKAYTRRKDDDKTTTMTKDDDKTTTMTKDDDKTTTMTKDDAKTSTTMKDRLRQAGVTDDTIDKYMPKNSFADDYEQRMSVYKAKTDKIMKKMDQIRQMVRSGDLNGEEMEAAYAKLQKEVESLEI